MRILFVSSSFPGQLGSMANRLIASHEVIFASYRAPQERPTNKIRHILLRKERPERTAENYPDIWAQALRNGNYCLGSFVVIRESSFIPDIIFHNLSRGGAFFLPQAFPESFLVGIADEYKENNNTRDHVRCLLLWRGKGVKNQGPLGAQGD